MAITADMVKELRDKTGAGMMECKKALSETGGDFDKAVNLLRQKGVAVAAKRESRATTEGTIGSYGSPDGTIGSMVELRCETSFVAKTDQFIDLANQLAKQVGTGSVVDVTELAAQPYIADPKATVAEAVTEVVGKLGEKIVVARAVKFVAGEKGNAAGTVGSYLHTGGQICVLVEISTETAAAAANEEVQTAARDIAMQIAWGTPKFLHRDEISAEQLEQEREVHRLWAIKEGKPEAALDRIVTGRLEKFYEEVVLLDQPFIRDSDIKISDLVKGLSTKLGEKIDIKRYARYRVGEQE